MNQEQYLEMLSKAESMLKEQLNTTSEQNMNAMKKLSGKDGNKCVSKEEMVNLLFQRHLHEYDVKKINWILNDEIPRLKKAIDGNFVNIGS